LKHIERTRVLLVLVTVDPGEGRSPLGDLRTLRSELERFDATLAKRPMVVAMSKLDLPEVVEAYPELRDALAEEGITVSAFSAATSQGVEALLDRVETLLAQHSEPVAPRSQALPVPPHKQAGARGADEQDQDTDE
jgi:GTP-binding protein